MFYNWLEELKEKYDDKPAITCENTLSYRQLYDLSCRFASVLIDNGVKKGDKVILWAFNSLDWIVEPSGTWSFPVPLRENLCPAKLLVRWFWKPGQH